MLHIELKNVEEKERLIPGKKKLIEFKHHELKIWLKLDNIY